MQNKNDMGYMSAKLSLCKKIEKGLFGCSLFSINAFDRMCLMSRHSNVVFVLL